MSFAAGEHAALRKRLSQGKPIYTTRVQAERGKYREGQTVKSPFGLLRVTAVTKFDDIKKHPFKRELTAGWLAEIGDHPFDHVRLVRAKSVLAELADDWGLMFTTVNARRSRGPCEIVCP